MIAILPKEWRVFQNITFTELSQILKHVAGLVKLKTFRCHFEKGKVAIQLEHLSSGQIPVIKTKTKDKRMFEKGLLLSY